MFNPQTIRFDPPQLPPFVRVQPTLPEVTDSQLILARQALRRRTWVGPSAIQLALFCDYDHAASVLAQLEREGAVGPENPAGVRSVVRAFGER